jgi:CheY-like chemotaxis protein
MAQVIDSLAQLAWPLIAVFVVIRIGPALRDVIRQRDVQAKGGPGGIELTVGGQPVSGQQAVDDQRKETETLRAQLSIIAAQVEGLTTHAEAADDNETTRLVGPGPTSYAAAEDGPVLEVHSILWVDGDPESNAYEVAALQDRGVSVTLRASNREAMGLLAGSQQFDALVTDMQRLENGRLERTAGLELIRWMKSSGVSIPVVVYAHGQSVGEHAQEALAAGAVGVTSSLTELLELLGVNFGPRSTSRLVAEILQVLEESVGESEQTVKLHGGQQVDVLLLRDGRRIGIEAKAWPGSPSRGAVEAVLSRLAALVGKGELDEGWLVTPAAPPTGGGSRTASAVRAFTIDELREHLKR